jgi:hypothetical protein
LNLESKRTKKKASRGVKTNVQKRRGENELRLWKVSTNGQDLHGQINQLNNAGCEVVFSEKFTCTKADRYKTRLRCTFYY